MFADYSVIQYWLEKKSLHKSKVRASILMQGHEFHFNKSKFHAVTCISLVVLAKTSVWR